ncbi:hypothetical protein [Paenibacillus thalictri]|uniref:SH3 domain-containing protein n=1 Tax=Paenibacillus thalictri TaxID=2527873 RepID=A0A4Q9DH88_9BACL|nr:hypothetical protein [Paenibacillus thalictri]TBL71199.1 hypothetical protein EYB31_30965 [Paenibacillus thalictri]
MNKLVLCAVMLLGISAGVSSGTGSAALPPLKGPPDLPKVITLFEETPIYNKPDASLKPSATLSPQDVITVGAEKEWYARSYDPTHPDEEKRWVQIETTWLGPQWMRLHRSKIGAVKLLDTHIWLPDGASIYDEPFANDDAAAVLTPQTVHAKAAFESPQVSPLYLIETTWLGDKWLAPSVRHYTNIEKVEEDVVLPTETMISDLPEPARLGKYTDLWVIPAQTVKAYEKYYDFYHIETSVGPKWVNKQFAQPEGVRKTDEEITLTEPAVQYLYPHQPYPTFGLLSPQKVKAYEKWQSPQGDNWFRIHSWNGDLWVKQETPGGKKQPAELN